jgi:hypothetical protein
MACQAPFLFEVRLALMTLTALGNVVLRCGTVAAVILTGNGLWRPQNLIGRLANDADAIRRSSAQAHYPPRSHAGRINEIARDMNSRISLTPVFLFIVPLSLLFSCETCQFYQAIIAYSSSGSQYHSMTVMYSHCTKSMRSTYVATACWTKRMPCCEKQEAVSGKPHAVYEDRQAKLPVLHA